MLFYVINKFLFSEKIIHDFTPQFYYWYVVYQLLCYTAFYFVIKYASKYRIKLLLLCSLISFLFLPEIMAEQSLSFVVGVWISDNKIRLNEITNKKYCLLLCIFLAIGLMFLAVKQMPDIRSFQDTPIYNLVQLLIKLPLGIVVILSCHFLKKIICTALFIATGIYSYELYLTQMPGLKYLNHYNVFIFIPMTILVAVLLHYINEKISKRIL